MDHGWREHAACCGTDPDLWFAPGGVQPSSGPELRRVRRARMVCGSCPVQPECLEFAMSTRQAHGVWGGLTEAERRALARKGRRQRRAEELAS